MARFVDADKLANKAEYVYIQYETGYDTTEEVVFLRDIDSAQTIDAVDVVRCKDCALHGNCRTEDAFRIAQVEDPFCCVGARIDKQAN